MAQANKMGPNRTGMDMSPADAKEMVKGAEELTDTAPPPRERVAAFRKMAIEESGAVGSVPVPGTFKGALATGKEKLKGHSPEVLINKLGQRLAFERIGTRLYDALIHKCEAGMDEASARVVSLDRLHQFRTEERDHALLVASVLEGFGADPTALTPDANVSALGLMGLPKVIAEPRTTLTQCLEALQVAELVDNVAWENLQELCFSMGLDEVSARFNEPVSQEKVHREVISDWINQLVLLKAT